MRQAESQVDVARELFEGTAPAAPRSGITRCDERPSLAACLTLDLPSYEVRSLH